jgi:hypothetical protein
MTKIPKRLRAITAATALALGMPLTVDTSSSTIIRLNDACAGATSCYTKTNYICSTQHDDYPGYLCATGCDNLQ